MLMRLEIHDPDAVSEAVWHKNVSLKVCIYVWRFFRNRWSTKDNLRRRGIPIDSQLCVSGCGQNETAEHLIIHCPTFGSLWQHVKTWLGVYSVDPQHVMYRFFKGGRRRKNII